MAEAGGGVEGAIGGGTTLEAAEREGEKVVGSGGKGRVGGAEEERGREGGGTC